VLRRRWTPNVLLQLPWKQRYWLEKNAVVSKKNKRRGSRSGKHTHVKKRRHERKRQGNKLSKKNGCGKQENKLPETGKRNKHRNNGTKKKESSVTETKGSNVIETKGSDVIEKKGKHKNSVIERRIRAIHFSTVQKLTFLVKSTPPRLSQSLHLDVGRLKAPILRRAHMQKASDMYYRYCSYTSSGFWFDNDGI
jgi:hypothetical protein